MTEKHFSVSPEASKSNFPSVGIAAVLARIYFLFGDTLGSRGGAFDTIATTTVTDPERSVRLDFVVDNAPLGLGGRRGRRGPRAATLMKSVFQIGSRSGVKSLEISIVALTSNDE